jgi:RNA polymerase sigma factor (sigma-70 family)
LDFTLYSLGVIDVSEKTASEFQDLVDRLGKGDSTARQALLQRIHDRVLRIATTLFDETSSVAVNPRDLTNEIGAAWRRLASEHEHTHTRTVDEFFGAVFGEVRTILLELARQQQRPDSGRVLDAGDEDQTRACVAPNGSGTRHDPGNLTVLRDFHQQIEQLPADLRAVFELRYYGGFSQAEIAAVLGLDTKRVSRRWLAATGRLAQWLKALSGSS